MSDATQRLRGLDRQEQAACLIAESALGAVAHAWDVGKRQRAVDAMLTLPDGRIAAFEVTNLAPEGALETASWLDRDNYKWPLPGKWWWTIEVGAPKDMRRLKKVYEKIVLLCEAQNVAYPERIGWDPSADPDLQWLVQSSCNMIGHPELGPEKGAHVVPLSDGGSMDDTLAGFSDALTEAFEADKKNIEKHFRKLENAQADERHFFIMLHTRVLPFRIFSVLLFDDPLPQEAPDLPAHISHLWLAPNFSKRVLLWSRPGGWQNIFPYKTA